MVQKDGTNDRLIFDASHLNGFDSLAANCLTKPQLEPTIRYGDTVQMHFRRIWNLRITYPDKRSLLWDDDISSTFRWQKYHPNVAAVFEFILAGALYIPTGQVFGGNTSASNFEPIAHARCLLAKQLSSNKSLLKKHWSILKKY